MNQITSLTAVADAARNLHDPCSSCPGTCEALGVRCASASAYQTVVTALQRLDKEDTEHLNALMQDPPLPPKCVTCEELKRLTPKNPKDIYFCGHPDVARYSNTGIAVHLWVHKVLTGLSVVPAWCPLRQTCTRGNNG